MEGFYARSELKVVEAPQSKVPKCDSCGLYKGCESPKMPVFGVGSKGVLVVGEAPGRTEDRKGKPFVGDAGEVLRRAVNRAGYDLDRDCFTTNALRCRPEDNRKPTEAEVEFCRPNVFNAIRELKPNVVLLLGGSAIDSVVGRLWRPEPGPVTRWVGWQCPSQEINAWVCPTYHPSYVMREAKESLDRIFEDHVASAFAHTRPPWRTRPHYNKCVTPCFEDDKACDTLSELRHGVELLAFDFETNMIKPDAPNSRILCCAVSNGESCVAFPWRGRVVRLMKEVLTSRVGKIGANNKFEDRWTRSLLGVEVKNWVWDTVLAAHCLDNRKGVSGVKFQAFARLGMRDYDSHIDPYKRSKTKGGYSENRMKNLGMNEMLVYCGLDAHLEFKLAQVQMRDMKINQGD